jgi:hypothetical protein
LSYDTPDLYKKGFEIGKRLKRQNLKVSLNALICKNAAEGKQVKNYEIQKEKTPASELKILNTYYGYLGCWDGYSKGGNPPAKISIPNPTGAKFSLRGGGMADPKNELEAIHRTITNSFQRSTTDGLQKLSEFLYQDAFDLGGLWDECFAKREADNWRIVSIELDERTLSYSPLSSHIFEPDDNSDYISDRISSEPYRTTPIRAMVYFVYYDDVNGYTAEFKWQRFVYSFYPQLFYSICPTAEQEDSIGAFDSTGWAIPSAAQSISIPKGKVDKNSNAYKTMFNVGRNFAKVSMASDTALSQCKSAMSSGMIRSRGIPTYLGAQASQIQSYLKTPSGFQGCLDGFGQ